MFFNILTRSMHKFIVMDDKFEASGLSIKNTLSHLKCIMHIKYDIYLPYVSELNTEAGVDIGEFTCPRGIGHWPSVDHDLQA